MSTRGWRALAKAAITLLELPVLQQQKGSQSCSSSGLSQVSPAFSEQLSAGFLGYATQISWKLKGRPLESEQGLYEGEGSYVGADAKIWHLRSQHHQKILLTTNPDFGFARTKRQRVPILCDGTVSIGEFIPRAGVLFLLVLFFVFG